MASLKSPLLPGLAGALCLPATISLTRLGRYPTAILVVVAIGALGGAIATLVPRVRGRPSLRNRASAFAIGALASELIAFTQFYSTYGYHDPELVLGAIGVVMEFGGITVFGGMATCVAAIVPYRLATRSSERPPASLGS